MKDKEFFNKYSIDELLRTAANYQLNLPYTVKITLDGYADISDIDIKIDYLITEFALRDGMTEEEYKSLLDETRMDENVDKIYKEYINEIKGQVRDLLSSVETDNTIFNLMGTPVFSFDSDDDFQMKLKGYISKKYMNAFYENKDNIGS
jgi:hypothetical protein